MNKKQIVALREKLNRIDCMQALIQSANSNILSREKVFAGKEISIQNNTDKRNSIYVSGTMKDKILNMINEESLEIIFKQKQNLTEIE